MRPVRRLEGLRQRKPPKTLWSEAEAARSKALSLPCALAAPPRRDTLRLSARGSPSAPKLCPDPARPWTCSPALGLAGPRLALALAPATFAPCFRTRCGWSYSLIDRLAGAVLFFTYAVAVTRRFLLPPAPFLGSPSKGQRPNTSRAGAALMGLLRIKLEKSNVQRDVASEPQGGGAPAPAPGTGPPSDGPLPDTGGSERLNRSLQPESRKVLLYLLSTEPKYLATG